MLEPLYSASEMRAAEERYPGYPGSAGELMERAGAAVAQEVLRTYPGARRVAVVCGGGANGGDGRIAARILRESALEVVETDDPGGGDTDVVIDALFGTGFHGSPREEAAAAIGRINATGAPVVSVDIPSGVDATTGEVAGAAVEADVTVTFHGRKVGLVVAPGRFHSGRVVVAGIGLEPAPTALVRGMPALLDRIPRRGARDSKFSAGSLLVVGGAPGTTSAAVLAATGALRADAGYVTLAVPAAALPVAETLALEPVKRGFEWASATEALQADVARSSAIALGPGLGRSDEARALVRALLERADLPAVVDADALFGLARVDRSAPTVLTPHAGELARLLGVEPAWVSAHRLEAAAEAAERFAAVVLLKGPDTIVCAPEGRVIVCDTGPPSLATAGTGDVLTGVVGAFLAKGVDVVDAAAAAAIAHGLAAQSLPHQAGLIASDVAAALPGVLDR
jgi:NAD(P)H-hydrate epimerase